VVVFFHKPRKERKGMVIAELGVLPVVSCLKIYR
jgi:hypothetical protein